MRARIDSETALTQPFTDAYWVSPGASAALVCPLSASGVTKPDSVIFANWKRLNDAPWAIDTNPTRNFNLLPYSINDSAVAEFFDPSTIARAASREIDVVLGQYSDQGFNLSDSTAALPSLAPSPAAGTGSASVNKTLSVQTDLIAVRDLIGAIDRSLTNGTPPSDDQLAMMQHVLDALQQRKQDY